MSTYSTESVTGANSLTLRVSADSWNGDPQMQILVDGVEAGTATVTSQHGQFQWQDVTVYGDFANAQKVEIRYLNDLWGGNPAVDRNLYVDKVTLDGSSFEAEVGVNSAGWSTGQAAALLWNGSVTIDLNGGSGNLPPAPTPPVPPIDNTGSSSLTFRVSADSWNGDPQMQILVDGVEAGTATVTSQYNQDQWQDVTVYGDYANAQQVEIKYLNDAWGGSSSADRNLFVEKVTWDGTSFEAETGVNSAGWTSGAAAGMFWNGSLTIGLNGGWGDLPPSPTPTPTPTPTPPAPPPAGDSPPSDTSKLPFGMHPVQGNDGTYQNFLYALGTSESTNNYRAIGRDGGGFAGYYQAAEVTLEAIGYYRNDGTDENNFVGGWTGKNGIWSLEDYLSSPEVQDAGHTEYYMYLWDTEIPELGLDDYVGQTVRGVKLTESGITAGSHLVGATALRRWVDGGSSEDWYGVDVASYLTKFAGYDMSAIVNADWAGL